MNFIKKIFEGKIDDSVHLQLIRFGKGNYKGRAPIILKKSKRVKLNGGFEFANDFALLAAEMSAKFEGFVWSKKELPGLNGKKKAEKYIYEVKDLDSEKIKELSKEAYYFLLDAEGNNLKLRIKKKLPKPGKDEHKIDDKFCQLEIDEKYFEKIKNDFFWDIGDCKKAKAVHEYEITEIVKPNEKIEDFAKLRELAKRKGKLIRTIDCDGKEIVNKVDFEA